LFWIQFALSPYVTKVKNTHRQRIKYFFSIFAKGFYKYKIKPAGAVTAAEIVRGLALAAHNDR
jgi:hypothetical protein